MVAKHNKNYAYQNKVTNQHVLLVAGTLLNFAKQKI